RRRWGWRSSSPSTACATRCRSTRSTCCEGSPMSPLLPLALIILLAPFVAFLLNAFVARRAWALAGASTILGVGIAFVASLLVLANGFLTLFIFWELVGLCSYLLIGFWYDRGRAEARPLVAEGYAGQYADARLSPPEAAKKAFLTTRLGDLGLLVGLLLIWSQTGTFTFSQVEEMVPHLPVEVVTAAALLVFCGAVG